MTNTACCLKSGRKIQHKTLHTETDPIASSILAAPYFATKPNSVAFMLQPCPTHTKLFCTYTSES